MAGDAPANTKELLLLLAERSSDAIMLLDSKGQVTWWSPGAERIFGIPSSEMLGEHVSRIFTDDDVAEGVPGHELAVARAGTAARDDRWLSRADGSRFWASGILVPLQLGTGQLIYYGKVLRNRTDFKEQLETFKNKAESAVAESHRKDVFLSTLSHELRNPLGSLINAAEMIRATVPETLNLDTPLGIINRQVENLRRLVDDLMDLSRLGVGKIELRKESVTLSDIIERAVEDVQPLINERRHQLEVLMTDKPILIEADPVRLEQVFTNLLNNAAKYTPQGGRIWIKAMTEGKDAVVHIEDTGVGITKEEMPLIFELFTQAESSRSQSKGGIGIGLSLVKQLVALHGGSVQVRSDGTGKGSEFSVRLPLSGRDAAPEPTE